MIALDKNVVVLGFATAAAIAGAYIVWGPSESNRRKRSRRVVCPGLVNLGNTCFLNAVLQALAPCTSVGNWLSGIVERRKLFSHSLAPTLQNVIRVLNNDSVEYTDEYCPSDVIQALQNRGWVIPSDEQDAHEMFHVLSETLSEEMAPCSRVVPLFDVSSLEESGVLARDEAASRINVDLPVLAKHETGHSFHGLLASQLQCKQCGFKCAIKYDSFDSLSLSLPTQFSGPLTLEQLFRRFVMLESVDDVVCENCTRRLTLTSNSNVDSCSSKYSKFVKKLTIGKLPRCLCIHIQRTVWLDSGMPMKRSDAVSFPEVLDMSPFVYHKYPMAKARPTTLNIDMSVRLVGGRRLETSRGPLSSATSPSVCKTPVTSPNSGPVNMLKALNYLSRLKCGGDGLYAVRPADRLTSKTSASTQRELQLLADAYSTESSPASSAKYKLVSVISHVGSVFSGHFVTYRRAPSLNGRRFPDEWLYTSDVVVRRVSVAEVMASNAYMLMYEKI